MNTCLPPPPSTHCTELRSHQFCQQYIFPTVRLKNSFCELNLYLKQHVESFLSQNLRTTDHIDGRHSTSTVHFSCLCVYEEGRQPAQQIAVELCKSEQTFSDNTSVNKIKTIFFVQQPVSLRVLRSTWIIFKILLFHGVPGET